MSEKYGPNTAEIEVLIEKVSTLTSDQAYALASSQQLVQRSVLKAYRRALGTLGQAPNRDTPWNALRDAFLIHISRSLSSSGSGSHDFGDEVWDNAWIVARYATLALLVRDLIPEEVFNALYSPWMAVMN